jgi:hypothetical protein
MTTVQEGAEKRTTYTAKNITNTDVGPRGIFTKKGNEVLEPGESRDVELDVYELEAISPIFTVNEPPGGGEDTGSGTESGTEGGTTGANRVEGNPGKDNLGGKK